MINYSLTLRNTIPGEPSEKKVYAVAQSIGTMNLREFAKHISEHGSPFDRSTIEGVLTKSVDCMREMLLAGHNLQLGDLGSFGIKLNSEGTATAAEFTAEKIKKVSVRWTPGADFRNLLEDAEFQYVTTKAEQAAARKAAKEAIDAESGNEPGGGGPNTDDDNGE